MSMMNGHENSIFNLLVSSRARREILRVNRDLPIRQALEPLLKRWGLNSNKVTIQLRYYRHALTAETLAGDAEGTEIYVSKQSESGDKALEGFHPFINKASLKSCTQPYIGRDGWYLVRESSSANGQFSLAVTFENQLRHFKINFSPLDGMYKVASKGFEDLHELFEYYRTHSIKKTAGGDIFLIHPIPQEGKPGNNPPAPKPENNPPPAPKPENNPPPAPKPENNPPPPPKPENNPLPKPAIQSLPITSPSNRPLPPLPDPPSHHQVNNKPHFQPNIAPVHKPENIQPIQDNRTPVATNPSVNRTRRKSSSSTLPRPKHSGERPLPPIPSQDEDLGKSFPNPPTKPTPKIPFKKQKPAIASNLFPNFKNIEKNRSHNDLNKPPSLKQNSEEQFNHAHTPQSPSFLNPTPQLPHSNSNYSNSSNNEKEVPEIPPPRPPKGPATPSNSNNIHTNSSKFNYPTDPKQENQQTMNGSSTPQVSHANDPSSDDALPPNWVQVYSKSRAKFYYFNQVTSETKWSRPLHGKEVASKKQSNGLIDRGRSISPSEAGQEQLMRGRSFSEAKKPKRQSPPLPTQKPSPLEKRGDKIQNRTPNDIQSSSRPGYSPEPSSPLEKTRNWSRTQSFRSNGNNANIYDSLSGSEPQPPNSNNVQPRHSMQHVQANRQASPLPILNSPSPIPNGLPAPNSKQQPVKHSPQTQNPSKHSAPVNSVPPASAPQGKPVTVGKHTIPAPPPNIPSTLSTRAASLPTSCTNPKQEGKSTTLPKDPRKNLLDQIRNPSKLRPVSPSDRLQKEPSGSSGTMLVAISNLLEKRKQMVQDSSDESDYEDADDEW